MESPSPARTRLSQHLAKFAYDSGKRSPLKLEPQADQAVKTEAVEQVLQLSGQPATPSPRRRAKHPTLTPSTASPLPIRDRKARREIESDEQDSPLSDLSDMSESTERSSKRRRTTEDAGRKPKVKKVPRGYADPSVYAHLDLLPDQLREGLDGECNSPRLVFTK